MAAHSLKRRLPALMLALLAVPVLAGAGCALLVPTTVESAAGSVATSAGTNLVMSEGLTESRGGTVEPPGRYYEFGDIYVPAGLSLNKDRTMIFNVGGFKAGVLVLDGRLETSSLSRFFIKRMPRDHWELLGYFTYPQTAIFFGKPDRSCVVHIHESRLYTHVAIWVTPIKRH